MRGGGVENEGWGSGEWGSGENNQGPVSVPASPQTSGTKRRATTLIYDLY